MRIFCLFNNWLGWQALQVIRRHGDEIVGVALHPIGSSKYGKEIKEEIANTPCLVVDGSQLRNSHVLEQVRNLHADIAISVLFRYILKPEFISLFPQGCINLHLALLPHNRGAFPNVWSIVTSTPAGVTIHYVDEGVDTGDVIAQKEVPIEPTDTGATLYRKLELDALELLNRNWPSIQSGVCSRRPQPTGVGSCHRVRDVENIDKIDLKRSYRAEDLLNIIRARTFSPYAGAYFVHQGRKVFLRLELQEEGCENDPLDNRCK